jgi:RNA chaperone Hfq
MTSAQDKFLADNIGKIIHVYTVDRYHFRGTLLSFDTYTILVSCEGQKQIIYKSAIVAVMEDDFE